MTLQDAMADIADLGATGIEILGEGNIPGYPHPDPDWTDTWHRLLDRYGLTPTNYGSWVGTAMWRDRDLTAEEAREQLERDLRLAKLLGFTSIRPKFGVVTPELDPHPVCQPAVERVLDLAADLDIVICPEIHSPTPIRHPVTQAYLDFIDRTGSGHFKLLIDTGIFQTAPVDDGHEGFEGKKRPAFLEPLAVPMSDLAGVLPHVHLIQAKFFEIDDHLDDLHIPWTGAPTWDDVRPGRRTSGVFDARPAPSVRWAAAGRVSDGQQDGRMDASRTGAGTDSETNRMRLAAAVSAPVVLGAGLGLRALAGETWPSRAGTPCTRSCWSPSSSSWRRG